MILFRIQSFMNLVMLPGGNLGNRATSLYKSEPRQAKMGVIAYAAVKHAYPHNLIWSYTVRLFVNMILFFNPAGSVASDQIAW